MKWLLNFWMFMLLTLVTGCTKDNIVLIDPIEPILPRDFILSNQVVAFGLRLFFNFFQKYRLRYKNNVYFCIVNDINMQDGLRATQT